ncbi:MAG: DUF1844 domain-containing protein [Armatimonadota bacterium]
MTDEPITTPDEPTETTAEEPQEEPGQAPPEMRTEDAIRFAISLFADLAWINMGIRSNPATNETKTDMGQARLAIDALAALVQLTEGRLDPREVREMNNLLSTLRLNYVERAAK